MLVNRRGAGSLGCLFTLLIVAAVVYFGVNVAEVYWHAYQFEDNMRQDASFATHLSNDQILIHLRAVADSLDLPADARAIAIRRTDTSIVINAEYDRWIDLPGHVRQVHFHPNATGRL